MKFMDKEIIIRCLDLMSVLILYHCDKINNYLETSKIMNLIISLIHVFPN